MLVRVKVSTKERKYNIQINILNVLAYDLMLNPGFSLIVLQHLSLVVVLILLFAVVELGPSQNLSDVAVWMLWR